MTGAVNASRFLKSASEESATSIGPLTGNSHANEAGGPTKAIGSMIVVFCCCSAAKRRPSSPRA